VHFNIFLSISKFGQIERFQEELPAIVNSQTESNIHYAWLSKAGDRRDLHDPTSPMPKSIEIVTYFQYYISAK